MLPALSPCPHPLSRRSAARPARHAASRPDDGECGPLRTAEGRHESWARMPEAVVAEISPAARIVRPVAIHAVRHRVVCIGAVLRCDCAADDRARGEPTEHGAAAPSATITMAVVAMAMISGTPVTAILDFGHAACLLRCRGDRGRPCSAGALCR